ncbi:MULTISPECIES: Uma2 family endonuclease [Streptomyces]|uniref:Uma2 family endonuclease n=1 Tax=Streptomyces TaxID=1883 RepID=UPI00163CB7D7|nr:MULTISPECIES: Uma2 family endonuclease [Streptomyces]MBC2879439.1 Uma2 family endonuclease [Streptomyces sp. TYQ1024]UBI39838.1 Uma2 family endonuclease [Streptomyces mobaraensis]UKW32419.1 Uma2 family endonuclease [Streptomyces sp. TYQ1024]
MTAQLERPHNARMESPHDAGIESMRNAIERVSPLLKGFKIEAVGDRVIMTPQSSVRSWTVFDVQTAIVASGVDRQRVLNDVEFGFPGEPDRCPDVAITDDGSTDPYSHEDLLAAIEIVSSKNDKNDYVVKTRQYARFGVPAYLIIDPFRGECDLLTNPRDDAYASRQTYKYGDTIPLRLQDGAEIEIPTASFKRRS